jgi:hypothetical protein
MLPLSKKLTRQQKDLSVKKIDNLIQLRNRTEGNRENSSRKIVKTSFNSILTNQSIAATATPTSSHKTTSSYTNPFKFGKSPFQSQLTPAPSRSHERLKTIINGLTRDKVKSDTAKVLNIIFDDILSTNLIDYTKLTKGRSVEDTRTILNYMLLASYNIEGRKQFDKKKFFDEIIVHPTEVSPDGLYEGDIVLSKDQAYTLFSKYLKDNHVTESRKVIKKTVYRWPAGVIHFCLDPLYTQVERDLIIFSLTRWKENTCLVFTEVECSRLDLHLLKFVKGTGCWSPVGFVPDSKLQEISIGDGCFQVISIDNYFIPKVILYLCLLTYR